MTLSGGSRSGVSERNIYVSVFQKFREYLEGSNLISKLQAKHDILKKALAEGETAVCPSSPVSHSVFSLCDQRLCPLSGYKAELLTTR